MNPLNTIRQNWREIQPTGGTPWRQALPGVIVLGVIVAARLLGLFQELELKMLDTLLRWRPAEPTDERILIIGIDEADIQQLGTYPVPDRILAELIQTLERHNPRAIGIDIFRDMVVEPGHQELVETLAALPHVIGIEHILSNPPIAAPPSLPAERIGFVDFPTDDDGFVRRALLGSPNAVEEYRFSLALRLTETYLQPEGMALTNGVRDPWAKRFGDTEFSSIPSNTGGYVGADTGGHQVLLNGRRGANPFRQVSLAEVLEGRVDPDWIQDSIVLVGVTSPSVKDFINSAAVVSNNPGLVYGVVMQAHATSQLVSAVLDDRPMLRTWPQGVEYLWIILWGGVGMVLIRSLASPSRYLLVMGVVGLAIAALSYGLLVLGGWWVPLVPALVVFSLNGLVLPGFYLYDQTLRSRIEARQRAIDQTYTAIHNGPLQTLALLLRDADRLDWPQAVPRLHQLNQELRDIRERLPADLRQTATDLTPLHEDLWETYTATLQRGQREFPGLQGIKFQVVDFKPLNADYLSTEDRQALCQFLEEALLNVGKHGVGVSWLTVVCQATASENLIQVTDNGQGQLDPLSEARVDGWGTQQAQQLARRLRGHFQRRLTEVGTCCELRWPLPRP